MNAWITLALLISVAPEQHFWALNPAGDPSERITVGGIPFVTGPIVPELIGEGDKQTVAAGGVRARRVYLLGGVNSHDIAMPGWAGSDDFHIFFLGDRAGELELHYANGATDIVPLVFGYSIWWRDAYRAGAAPFHEDSGARDVLDRALCVAQGIDGYKQEVNHYFLPIELRDLPLTSITLRDNPEKVGVPVLEGVTFVAPSSEQDLPDHCTDMGLAQSSPELAAWLDDHIIDSRNPWPAERRKALDALRTRFHTLPNQVNDKLVRKTNATFAAGPFEGPQIEFSGPPEAAILTKVYQSNLVELLDRVDPDGMVHESRKGASYYNGFGGWAAGLGAFHDTAYTRNHSHIVLADLGYSAESERIIDFFHKWIMYFPQSYPDIQLDEKPVPGHATVIANQPHVYFDDLRHLGWPTRYESRDFGNPETDGHGMIMLGAYRVWNKLGRSTAWVRARWDALSEMAEFIPWALDNPTHSFSEHGLLYAESEGGMSIISLYANVACYYGLLGHADMAEAVGEAQAARRWRQVAEGLRQAIDGYMVATIEPWGEVWDPKKTADWNYRQGVLAPIIFALDYWGPDALRHLPHQWRERTERSYRMIVADLKPDGCAPAGFGYGQGYFTQSALLLDQSRDAETMANWLARLCFAPHLPNPYRVPEGAAVAEDGSQWRRWGDLGNLYQMVEALKTVNLMVGVDDYRPDQLNIMPRLPFGWDGVEVSDYPVCIQESGRTVEMSLKYRLRVETNHLTFQMTVSHPISPINLRLGPITPGKPVDYVTLSGQPADYRLEDAGQSQWVWLTLPGDFDVADVEVRLREPDED